MRGGSGYYTGKIRDLGLRGERTEEIEKDGELFYASHRPRPVLFGASRADEVVGGYSSSVV